MVEMAKDTGARALRRRAAVIYLADEEMGRALEDVIERHGVVAEFRPGGVAEATRDAATWAFSPDYLILDVTGIDDPPAAILDLAGSAPEGETDVIALGAQDRVRLYRSLRQIGVYDYLTLPCDPNDFEQIIVDLERRRMDDLGFLNPERLVVVTNARGGAGASTVAAAIADDLTARRGQTVLLLDLDLEGGVQNLYFNVDPTPGLMEALEEPGRVDTLFLERSIARPRETLGLFSADYKPFGLKPRPEGVQAICVQAAQGFDRVVVDLPRGSTIGEDLLDVAGTVVIVTPPTLEGLRETLTLIDRISRSATSRSVVVAINRNNETGTGILEIEEIEERLQGDVVVIPYDPRTIAGAHIEGRALPENINGTARALQNVANRVIGLPDEAGNILDRILRLLS